MSAVRKGSRTGAGGDVELDEDAPEVILHRVEAATEDHADLRIRLPFGNPMEHLRLAQGDAELLNEHGKGVLTVGGVVRHARGGARP